MPGNHSDQRGHLRRHDAQNMTIGWVIAAASLARFIGDNLGFWSAAKPVPDPRPLRPSLVGLDARRQKLGQYLFRQHGGKIVFFGRFVALRASRRCSPANRSEPFASSPSTRPAGSPGRRSSDSRLPRRGIPSHRRAVRTRHVRHRARLRDLRLAVLQAPRGKDIVGRRGAMNADGAG